MSQPQPPTLPSAPVPAPGPAPDTSHLGAGNIPPGPDLRAAAAVEYPELASPAAAGAPAAAAPAPEVPADFAAAHEAQLAAALTPEEVAEFRALRAEKKARDAAAAAAVAEAAAKLSPPTHYVHLATGDVVDGSTIATHWCTAAGALIPVAGVFLKPEFVPVT
jgi:hypothetical protein